MPDKQQAILLINSYLDQFRQIQQKNPKERFASKAILVLREFIAELNDKYPDPTRVVYPNLGFHEGLWGVGAYFEIIEISNNDLPCYVLMEKFISSIQKYDIDTPVFNTLKQFQEQALSPAFPRFKREMSENHKSTLQALFASLQLLVEKPLAKNMELDEQDMIEELDNTGLSLRLLNSAVIKGAKYAPIETFITAMDALLKAPALYSRDLICLKQPALEAQQALVQIPEIKKIDRFHWLVNWICDFINTHIYDAFESRNIKNINTFFAQLDVTIKDAEQIEDKSLEEVAEEGSVLQLSLARTAFNPSP